jgi:transcriptional regulator with XRE-family HTH domain
MGVGEEGNEPGTGLGGALVGARSRAGLSQEELAQRAGMSVRAIRDIERGRVRSPQRRTVEALGAALELNEEEREHFLRVALGRRASWWGAGAGAPDDVPTVEGLPPPALHDELSGRDGELEQVLAWIGEASRTAPDGSNRVIAVSGPPGIGKTALAITVAARTATEFPDGCFFLDLRGIDEQPVPLADAVTRVLRAVGLPVHRLPASLDERLDLLRAVLQDRRVLLILDNAGEEAQVRPLLPVGAGSVAVVTSRRALTGLSGARHLSLDVLDPDGGLDLLRRILGPDRMDAEPGAAARLVELCGRLPLALRIVGDRLVVRPGWHLADLADRLADESRRLSLLTAGDVQVRAACLISYRQLGSRARRVYRRLSLGPSEEFAVAQVAVLVGVPEVDVEGVLEELTDRSLLQPGSRAGRYRLHNLLRLFARERLDAEESPQQVRDCEDRMLRWLLARATESALALDVERAPNVEAGPDRAEAVRRAFGWLERERDNWLAAAWAAPGRGMDEELLAFALAMHWYSDTAVGSLPWADLFGLGVAAARALGREDEELALLNFVAWALYADWRLDEALDRLEHVRAWAERRGDALQECWAHGYTTRVLNRLARPREALAHGARATELAGAVPGAAVRHYALTGYAEALSGVGRPQVAAGLFEQVLADFEKPAGRFTQEYAVSGVSMTLIRYAQTLVELDRWAEAGDALERARRGLASVPGYAYVEAVAAFRSGEVYRHLGDERADAAFREALDRFTEMVDPQMQARARQMLLQHRTGL